MGDMSANYQSYCCEINNTHLKLSPVPLLSGVNNISLTTPADMDILHAIDTLNMARLVCTKILIPILIVFGVTANLLNIVVLTRKWMLSSTNTYLTGLALADILYLVTMGTVVLKLYPAIGSRVDYLRAFLYLRVLANFFSNTATWLTCSFTLERWIAVCRPMLGRKICTRERAMIITTAVFIVVFLCTAPDFLAKEVKLSKNSKNETDPKIVASKYAAMLSNVGYSYITQSVFVFIPIILLIVFNILLIQSVVKANRERTAMCDVTQTKDENRRSRNQTEQQRITIMLIVVVIAFCVLQLPSATMQIIQSASLSKTLSLSTAAIFRLTAFANVANLFIITNAASNFILYSCFSTKFRRTFKKVFFRCGSQSDRYATMLSEYPASGHHTAQQHVLHQQKQPLVAKSDETAQQNVLHPANTTAVDSRSSITGACKSKSSSLNCVDKNGYLSVNRKSSDDIHDDTPQT